MYSITVEHKFDYAHRLMNVDGGEFYGKGK